MTDTLRYCELLSLLQSREPRKLANLRWNYLNPTLHFILDHPGATYHTTPPMISLHDLMDDARNAITAAAHRGSP